MKRLIFVAIGLVVWTTAAWTSPQQGELPVLSVRTDLVTLAVTVVDRRGTPVAGLGREQFAIYDNGEPAPIEFFASQDVPATIGLIIDSSGSMRGHRDQLSAAADALAATWHPLDEFFTLHFNEAVWPGLPPGLPFTGDAAVLRTAVTAWPSAGMTALYDALARALDQCQLGTRDRRALVVISDGGDNASSQTLESVVERARRTSVVIYSVTFFDPDDRDARPQVLKTLATESGGRALVSKRPEDVLSSFSQIATDIRSGYTMAFTPSDTSNGGYRSIRVVADAGDRRPLIVRTRAGYYAAPSGKIVK